MLGTALPMSAQNKSFTVNRNDGASQKYSYSQGDRLVLSREDSQGKKHADFVEQQVYVGNAVHNIPLASIESITFDTQATEDEGKTFTVQESGGKIEYDDITIDFPSGTFNSSTKVTVSEVEKGKIDGDSELSKFYRVKLNSGVRQDFKVAVKSNEYANDNVVKMQFLTQGWVESYDMNGFSNHLNDVTYANGAYVAEIPAMENPDDTGDQEVYFGLSHYISDDTYSARTRADAKEYNINWPGNNPQKKAILEDLNKMIPEALEKIKELGFVKPKGTIDFNIDTPWADIYFAIESAGYGAHATSFWCKAWGAIYLNSKRLLSKEYDKIALQKTVIHELLHHYQQFYDPRVPSRRNNMAIILDEATAVWSERFFGAKLSDITNRNAKLFLPCINPVHEEIHNTLDEAGDSRWGDRYQNTGYGMSALIEYLSQKLGDIVVRDMYKKRWDNNDGVEDNIGYIEAAVDANSKDKSFKIFTQAGYQAFVEALGSEKVYAGFGFENLLHKRKGNGDIGVVEKELEADKPVYLTNYAFGYGALVEALYTNVVKLKLINEKLNGLENSITTVEQTTEGLTTWVYYNVGDKYHLIGQTKKGSPLNISVIFHKEPNRWVQHPCYLVTIKDNFKDDVEILAGIKAIVEEKKKVIEVTPDALEFESSGGTKKLTVTTSQPKFKSEVKYESEDKDEWLTVKNGKDGVEVTATANSNPKKRKATIIVYALNSEGKNMGEVSVPVTQNPSFLLNVEPNPITLPGYGSEFKNGKMTGSFTVKYIKDAKSVNVRAEFEQEDKDKSWLTLDGDWASQTSDDMLFICKRNFTVAPNTSFTKSRSAKIIVELTMPDGSKPDPEIVPVTQEPMQAELKLEPGKVDLQAEDSPGAATSDVVSVNIESNLFEDGANVFKDEEFTTSGDEGGKWIFAERNGKKIDIWATAYQEETGFRKGTLTYTVITTTGESVPASVEVTQHGRAEGLPFYIDPSYIHFPYKGGALDVTVLGEKVEKIVDYDFVWNDNSAGFGASSSPSSMTIHMLCEQNPFKEARSFIFSITVELKGGTQYTRFFTVHQDGEVSDDPDNPDDPDQGGTEKHNYNGKFIGSWAWGKPGDAVYEKYTFASDGTLYRNGVVYGTFTVIADDHDSDPSGGLILEKKVLSVTRNGKQSTWNITVAYEFDSVDMQGNYIYAEVLYVGWNPYDKVEDEE